MFFIQPERLFAYLPALISSGFKTLAVRFRSSSCGTRLPSSDQTYGIGHIGEIQCHLPAIIWHCDDQSTFFLHIFSLPPPLSPPYTPTLLRDFSLTLVLAASKATTAKCCHFSTDASLEWSIREAIT